MKTGFIIKNLLIFSFLFIFIFSVNTAKPDYTGILTPTAYPAYRPGASLYLITYPAGVMGQLWTPLTKRATVSIYGGISGYPAGFIGSGYARFHILRPNLDRWGLAVQAQSGLAAVFSDGEGAGGLVNALIVAASSPLKPTRLNFGATLHTMPGSEFEPAWEEAKDYDFLNPQLTLFLSAGHAFKRSELFVEMLWIAVGADDGWDSTGIGFLGYSIALGNSKLSLGSGLLIRRAGSSNPSILPVPPLVRFSSRF